MQKKKRGIWVQCVGLFCVPQQDGPFMEGLHRSLTEKTLIQHILSMFTYRDTGVGGNLRVCVCVRERELIWYHPVGLLCTCVCVRKWLHCFSGHSLRGDDKSAGFCRVDPSEKFQHIVPFTATCFRKKCVLFTAIMGWDLEVSFCFLPAVFVCCASSLDTSKLD